MSLHSVQVVHCLTTSAELPSEFVQKYGEMCLGCLGTIEHKDKDMQNALVSLLPDIAKSLMRNKRPSELPAEAGNHGHGAIVITRFLWGDSQQDSSSEDELPSNVPAEAGNHGHGTMQPCLCSEC